MNNNCVIYARYSSSSQDAQTIEVQVKECYKYAEAHGLRVIDEYIDEAKTGRNDKRTSFKKMIEDSKNNTFKYVIVYKLDRFARSMQVSITSQAELEKNGVEVLSTREELNKNASGIFMKGIYQLVAEFYSNDYAERISKGLENNASKSLTTGNNVPLGFITEKETKKLIIDPINALVVKDIFERYSKGECIASIVKDLNSKGIKTVKGKKFRQSSLDRMLINKKYIGIYTYKGKEMPIRIPRIISDELFYQVQDRIAKNKKAPGHQKAFKEYLLTLKMYCGYCGEMMTGYSAKKGKYTYYGCKGKKAKKCNKLPIDKDYIENIVVKEIKTFLNNQKNIDLIMEELEKLAKKEREDKGLKDYKKQLIIEKNKKDNLLDALSTCTDEDIRKDIYEKMNDIKSHMDYIELEIARIEAPFDTQLFDKVNFVIKEMKDGKINDLKFQKMLINAFVNKVIIYDDKAVIVFLTNQKKSIKLFDLFEQTDSLFYTNMVE